MTMQTKNWVLVERDCEALLIPTAVPITVPAGTDAQIVQTLGGHITVNIHGNLARIDKSDADALGIDPSEIEETKKPRQPAGPLTPLHEDDVWAQLRTCYDPEIPVNIVDLGLIYDCKVKPQYNSDAVLINNKIDIKMTLTAPGCGMGPVIVSDAEAKIMELPNATEVDIELVFEPPWDKDKMTEAAKLELGLL